MKINTMNDLYIAMLKDILYAEKKLVKTLPKLAKAATSPQLKTAFENHAEESKVHVDRLEQVFASLDKPARGETCEAMDGLIEEGEEMISDATDPQVLDAGLIACAQKVEHYEIATYGTLCVFAKMLGYRDQAALLQKTLDEEKQTDSKLTKIAETTINQTALAA